MTVIRATGQVDTPFYYHNGKAYINVKLDEKTVQRIMEVHDNCMHRLRGRIIQNPLQGDVLKIKIPMRKDAILCAVTGDKPLRVISKGEHIDLVFTYCGAWNYKDFCGYAWKLNQVNLSTIGSA